MANREPRWVKLFLRGLEQVGNVRLAAERAGVDFSTAYQRRKRHADFAERWEGALGRYKGLPLTLPPPGAAPSLSLGGERGSLEETLLRPDGKVARVGEGRWSKRSEEAFLIALTTSGSVSLAAKAAGFSTTALYRRRLKDRHFLAAWDAALETGKARVQSYLVEAATRTFDPDELPIAPDHEIPKVTVGEAINIAKMPARDFGSGSGPRNGRGRWHDGRFYEDDHEWTAEEKQEVVDRIVMKLEGLKSRNDRMMVEAGWTEHEVPPLPCYNSEEPSSVWIPPGWRLVWDGGEA